MDLSTNMKAIGKRFPYLVKYKLASSKEGVIQAVDVEIFADCGITPNETAIPVLREYIDNGACMYFTVNSTLQNFVAIVEPLDLYKGCTLGKG